MSNTELMEETNKRLQLAIMDKEVSVQEYYRAVLGALRKQSPKPVDREGGMWCPACFSEVDSDRDTYCPSCGQLLLWDDADA